MTTLQLHPFEKAGLGAAPFRFIGMSEKVYVACQGAPEQPGGTCDYCGTGIRYLYHIESADKKTFVVGCECVKKTDRAALINASEFEQAVAKRKREVVHAHRAIVVAREEKRIEGAFARLDASGIIQAYLASRPHPFASFAAEGKTLADYVEWMRHNAGHSGRLKIAKVIENL